MLHKIRTVRTRMLSTMMAIIMLMSLIPVTASADGEGTVPTNGGALSGNYKLTGDVTLTAPLTVAAGENVTIDLNGHNISYAFNESGTCSLIDNDGTLTLTDTSEGKNGSLVLTGGEGINKYAYIQAVSNDGTFTLNGGTLKVTSAYACYPVGIRTSAAGAVTIINGGDIWVEKTEGSSSGTAYGIWADKNVDSTIALASGDITVKNSSGATYGVYTKGGYPSDKVLTLSGGSISVEGTSSTYGVFLQYIGLIMSGTNISVKGTSTAYGVYCASANENRQVSGGSVMVDTTGVAFGLYDYAKSYLKVTNCTVNVPTSGTSNTYPCYYCDISGGSYTGKMLSGCTVTGGSFSFDPVGFYEPYVYQAVENPTGTWIVSPYTGTEAWVKNLDSNKTYASLTVAAREAAEGDTLQLQEDIDLKGYAATIDKGLTLDLNGHELYSSSSLTNALLISGGTVDYPVTITDNKATSHANAGTITSNMGIWIQSGYAVVEKVNLKSSTSAFAQGLTLKGYAGDGEVQLRGINIEAQGKSAQFSNPVCAVYIDKTVTVSADDYDQSFPLTATIHNTAQSNNGNTSAFYVASSTPNIQINGGTYAMTAQGEATVIGANSSYSTCADIHDGYFTLTSTSDRASVGTYAKNAKVYGGYFNVDPSSSLGNGSAVTTESVPDGYTHAVKVLPVAKVGEVEYNTLQAAIDAAAPTGSTVTLIRNAVAGSTVTIDGNVTIEKGGYSITFNGSPALKLSSDVSLPQAMSDSFDAMVNLSDGSVVYFNTLTQALNNYATVKLARDVSVTNAINLSGNRTIDFNGYDLTSSADKAFDLTGFVTPIKEVDISFTNSGRDKSVITGGIDIVSQNYIFTFTLGKNVEVRDNNPLFLQGNGNDGCITANIYGSLVVEVESGEAEYAAIQGNGQAQYAGTVINIYDGALVDGNGNSAAIYHPQNGILNVYGGTVTGETGIYMKSGTLNISGGTISGTGEKAAYQYNGSGFVSTGEALVVDNCIYPGGVPEVKITDGEFISTYADPIGSYKKSDDQTQTGGPEAAVTGFVKGGNFSESLATDLLDASLKYELNDTQDNPNAPFSYYSTIQAAADAAKGNLDAVIQTTGAANTDDGTSTYTVTFKDGASGTEYNIKATREETITLPTPTRSGYTLLGWYEGSTRVGSGGASYQVTKDVTLEAKWTLTPTTSDTPSGSDDGYSISVPSSSSIRGGSITVSPRSAEKGDKIAITLKPDSGYELDKLLVTDGSGRSLKLTQESANRYTFTMPASRVDIEVSFKIVESAPVNPFVDVSKSDYYYDAVLWAVENGVTSGTGATTFGPNVTVTRGQMMTFLWRAHGSPKVTGSNPFTDISASDYYYNAVLWAVKNGITSGTSATTFDLNAAVTRSQAVTFQWRAAGSTTASGSSFADVAADTWYADAVAWAVSNGITSGIGGNNFGPDVAVSRAQAVTFLYREQE